MNLRLAVIESKPLITYVYDAHKHIKGVTGVFGNFLAEISTRLNISYTLHQPLDREWGVHIHGKWTGMFGLLANNKADMILGPSTITNARMTVVTFSEQLYASNIAILSSPSHRLQYNYILAHIASIDLVSWILLLLSTLAVFAFITFSQKMPLIKAFWLLVCAFLYRPLSRKLSLNKTNFLLMVYFYCMILFWYSINKVINAYYVTIKNDVGIDSVEELVRNKNVIPTIRGGAALESLFQEHHSPEIIEIWQRIKANHYQGLVSRHEYLKKSFINSIANKKVVHIASVVILRKLLIDFCWITPDVYLRISRPFFYTSNSIAFNKNLNNTIINKINILIVKLKEMAIFQKWFNDEFFKIINNINLKCVRNCIFRTLIQRRRKKTESKTLGLLRDTLPLFYVYICATLMSAVVLAAELVLNRIRFS